MRHASAFSIQSRTYPLFNELADFRLADLFIRSDYFAPVAQVVRYEDEKIIIGTSELCGLSLGASSNDARPFSASQCH